MSQGAHGQIAHVGLELAKTPVLRLVFFWKVLSLDQWRIFEFQLPHGPLLPSFPRIDHRIVIDFDRFCQIIRHILHISSFLQVIQKYVEVHIPIPVGLSHIEVLSF